MKKNQTKEAEPALIGATENLSEEQLRLQQEYFSASQWKLIWWRFRRHRSAMFGLSVLGIMAFLGLFAEFFAPYKTNTREVAAIDAPPQIPRFCDSHGCSFRPFVHGVITKRDPRTLRKISEVDPDKRLYLEFFAKGEEVKLFSLIPMDVHFFGLQDKEAFIHLWGTDSLGRDVFSRTIYATRTSLSIGVLGVLIAFFMALIIGGIAGYWGGWVDNIIQRITEVVRVVPVIPLYMGLMAAMPSEWSTTQVYFAMTLVLGMLGWPTLARRVRSQLLSMRGEDFIVSARLAGATPARIIAKHMLPGFTSFIIVDLVISFPYMILSETALSFVGLGLRPPAVSWGVMLQGAQSVRAIEHTPWLFIPAIFVVVAVLAFTIVGDGMRDAADPYSH